MKKIIECVPNFSEGRNKDIIDAIVAAIASDDSIRVLDVDPGEATNRTVVTFVGEPEVVIEGALRGMKAAAELIDMRKHHGAHPRMGATDVCPLVPVQGVTLEECAEYARELARRASDELNIPCYAYEAAAFRPERKNLAICRQGEYEGLESRMGTEDGPDYGNRAWDDEIARTGCTAVGARNFLVAVNFNLNTTSTRRANAIAFDVREKGRPKREGGKPNGKPIKDADGNTIMLPGTLKGTKAIGWYIDEYGIAQVSMNITDIDKTPLHMAFDEVTRAAAVRGIRVTGAEIVGLIPRRVLIEAGKYYLQKQQRSLGIPDEEIIRIAIKSMGLDELKPFVTSEKVIEDMVAPVQKGKLVSMTCIDFADETASESPAPGGGSVSAYIGCLGVSLGAMVANLSAHKAGWDDRWEEFSDLAVKCRELQSKLLEAVDKDTDAFNEIMAALSLPKSTPEEKQLRAEALENATYNAAMVPLKTMELAADAFSLLDELSKKGNPASITDIGVGVEAVLTAVRGAYLNVKVNARDLKNNGKLMQLKEEATCLLNYAEERAEEIRVYINAQLGEW